MFGADFTVALEGGIVEGLQELVDEEATTASSRRRFGLRELGRALDTLGVLVEAVRSAFDAEAAGRDRPQLADALTHALDAGEPIPAEAALSIRFCLALLVGLEFLKEFDDEELIYLASVASLNARRLDALLRTGFMQELRGEVARLRSQHAWESWDDEELERELRPWEP